MVQDRHVTGPPRDHGCWYGELASFVLLSFSLTLFLPLSHTHSLPSFLPPSLSLSLSLSLSQGIKAVIAENYERIHRSNLVGMGVVPLQFLAGETPGTLGLTGRESYTITLPTELTAGMLADVTVC